jgi:hypothetical protein
MNWVPDELRNACFTLSGKHHAVWVKLVAKSKSQVVHPPTAPVIDVDLSTAPGAEEYFEKIIAAIASSIEKQKQELEDEKLHRCEFFDGPLPPLPPLPSLDDPLRRRDDDESRHDDDFEPNYAMDSDDHSDHSDDRRHDSDDNRSDHSDDHRTDSQQSSSDEDKRRGRPQCLLQNTAVMCGKNTLILEAREQSKSHYRGSAWARAAVVGMGYGCWDDVLELMVLQSPGVQKCKEMHYNVWRNGVLERFFTEEHGGKDDRSWRRRVMRRYTVAMHVRFGARGLDTFWRYGMVTWPMLDAISVVIAAREEARRAAVAAHSRVAATHLAPEEVAEDMEQQQRQLTKQARAARHRAKTASNRARREEATRQPGGMCQWCGRQQHPCRTQCWVCEKLTCDRCTYHDSEDRKYLLCNSCFARRGSGPHRGGRSRGALETIEVRQSPR